MISLFWPGQASAGGGSGCCERVERRQGGSILERRRVDQEANRAWQASVIQVTQICAHKIMGVDLSSSIGM